MLKKLAIPLPLFWRTFTLLCLLLLASGVIWRLAMLPPRENSLPEWVSELIAMVLTVIVTVFVARRINQPLNLLSEAADRVHEGSYDSRLDESALTSEVRTVNRGFNRMARDLARHEEDRAVMLAGISHDLRTPLARLRLEVEMSVTDETACDYMVRDIDQLDAIISKFMDYARPGDAVLQQVDVGEAVEREARSFRDPQEITIQTEIASGLYVRIDPTDLTRVLQNLFENARRYGHHEGFPARVSVTARHSSQWIELRIRDQGPGVPADKLSQLTTPFYRGNAARTAASGAGLGLAIVEKAVQRMGGRLEIHNAPEGGMLTLIQLKKSLGAG